MVLQHVLASAPTHPHRARSVPAFPTDRPILIIPGLNDSEPEHWQSHWQRSIPSTIRVEQTDWERPTLGEWVAALVEALRLNPGAILVGHSLGCALIAHLARLRGGRDIGGALLVAPADVNPNRVLGNLLTGFAPMPLDRLPFPTTVVASRNDPYIRMERAAEFATAWGSRLHDLGAAGHINVASGHGPWEDGLGLLTELLDRVDAEQTAASGAKPS